MINSVNPQPVNQNKKSRNIGLSWAAYTAAGAVPLAGIAASTLLMKQMQKSCNSLPLDKQETIIHAVNDAFEKSGVKSKGIKLVRVKPLENNGFMTLTEQFKNLLETEKYPGSVIAGKNAKFDLLKKEILLPEKKLCTAGFHEIGHAMNNVSKLGKCIQIARPFMIASLLITLSGAFTKNKKATDEKQLSSKDKTINFIRNNAGKLAFAAFLPLIFEEGLATFKGEKLAKKLLSSDLMKSVKKTNRLGFISYLITAAAAGLSAMTAVKVKDHLVAKKEAKTQAS